MTRRREFLKAAGGASLVGASAKEPIGAKVRDGRSVADVTQAREMVRRGELGAIHFCRISHPGLRATASYILDQADCVMDIEPEVEGAAFLGSSATLVVSGAGWRVFHDYKK